MRVEGPTCRLDVYAARGRLHETSCHLVVGILFGEPGVLVGHQPILESTCQDSQDLGCVFHLRGFRRRKGSYDSTFGIRCPESSDLVDNIPGFELEYASFLQGITVIFKMQMYGL